MRGFTNNVGRENTRRENEVRDIVCGNGDGVEVEAEGSGQ